MRRRQVTVDGIPTTVVEAGDADADVATVLVHGNPGGIEDFLPLLEASGRRRRTIAMDMPGFGSTPPHPRFVPDVDRYAAHLAGLLDALGVTGAHLVLHDFGGPWGLQLAIDRPALPRSVLLVNTVGMPGYRWHRMARLWRTPGVGEAVMAAASPGLARAILRHDDPDVPDHDAARMAEQFLDPDRARVVLELYRSTPPDWGDQRVDAFRRLDVPVLVVWGDADPYISPLQAERFREPFPQARFVRLRGAGHWPMLTHPQDLEPVVLTWLDRQDPAGG